MLIWRERKIMIFGQIVSASQKQSRNKTKKIVRETFFCASEKNQPKNNTYKREYSIGKN